MTTMVIFEIFKGMYPKIRKAEISPQYIEPITTYLITQGAYQNDPNRYTFEMKSPQMLAHVKEIEKRWPVKFYEVKGKYFKEVL